MKRRKVLQSLAIGTIGSGIPFRPSDLSPKRNVPMNEVVEFSSRWNKLPDMVWLGEEYWANRLQDWRISDGQLECLVFGRNRNVHLLTHQVHSTGQHFSSSVSFKINEAYIDQFDGEIGFSAGLEGRYPGYQSACITGKGINLGVNHQGKLFVGSEASNSTIDKSQLTKGIRLLVAISGNNIEVTAKTTGGSSLASFKTKIEDAEQLTGNIALLADASNQLADDERWKVQFDNWQITGDRIHYNEDQTFGPIYFTQYTLEHGILKITAQLAPIDKDDLEVDLWFEKSGKWEKAASSSVRPDSRTAHFRVENWEETTDCPFKITLSLPQSSTDAIEYAYLGSIAAEPIDKESIVALAMSCNGDFGFPDHEVAVHGIKHNPDLIFFLGDQIYEGNGGYGVQNNPPYRKADLDFLRKWYLFGWSYRDLFRNRPSICLPDDHDVYHGNVWGEGGKKTIQEGTTKQKQDSGGYKLPADWVNMIQVCQTSHMPDPYDPSPIKQGIGVYYTGWKYAGLDFAIIEDRKFKSAPKNYLPDEADVENGFAQNLKYDFKSFQDPEVLELLGDRQMQFLHEWTEDWTQGVQMKALLSATSFMTLQTLPIGTKNDSVTGKLKIPEKGEYVQEDDMTRDMDSNGWPIMRRNEVVALLRKSHAVHIVGDQHLPSVAQYGVDQFGDGNFVFTVPALSNIFPRRWWPPVSKRVRPLIGRPDYAGDYHDGFGNKMTVFAAASPYKSHRQPATLYDRSTGYGVVKFNKKSRKIRFECWPRYMDPETQKEGQYADWPIEFTQFDNFGFTSSYHLPTIKVTGLDLPVLKIYSHPTGELVSTVRMANSEITAKVLAEGEYKILVGDPDSDKWEERILNTADKSETVEILFG